MIVNKKTIIQCVFMLFLLLHDVAVSLTKGETWGDDIIVSQNIRIGCTHENARLSFSDLSTLGHDLKKWRFHTPKTPDPSGRNADTIQNKY